MTATERLAEAISKTDQVVVFTGAGISTESGIPDFRGPDGIWKTQQPVYFDDFCRSEEARRRYWRRKIGEVAQMAQVEPNRAHKAVTRLHELGRLLLLITQNIDGLHGRAGMPDEAMVELHGTNFKTVCLTCAKLRDTREVIAGMQKDGVKAPRCECGGLLKPATISFGQSMPADAMLRAQQATQQCDVFVVIGSSLTVMPAAAFAPMAKQSGAFLAIVNRGQTPYDSIADACIDAMAGEVMEEVMARIESAA